jgi:hypothetical protein
MEPLADVITLLRPRVAGTKVLQGAGRWGVRRSRVAYAGFGLVLKGECWLAVDGHEPVHLATGDFVLMAASPGFTIVSDLCTELGVTRRTLYRFVGPKGKLRADATKLLKRKAQNVSS